MFAESLAKHEELPTRFYVADGMVRPKATEDQMKI